MRQMDSFVFTSLCSNLKNFDKITRMVYQSGKLQIEEKQNFVLVSITTSAFASLYEIHDEDISGETSVRYNMHCKFNTMSKKTRCDTN